MRVIIIAFVLSASVALSACSQYAHTLAYPKGGTVIFRNGSHTDCTFIVVRRLGPLPSGVVCYQGTASMVFSMYDVGSLRVTEPPILDCSPWTGRCEQ